MHRTLLRFASVLLVVVSMAVAGCGDDPASPPGEYGVITTWAGTGEASLGDVGVPPTQTSLYSPQDVSFDDVGTPYIVDWNNHRVLIVKDGLTEKIIGEGFGNGVDGPADEVALNHPTHVSFDPMGNLILSAWHNSKVMRMDFSTGWLETICGDGSRAFRGDGGDAIDAWLDLPVATVFDSGGRMYISDTANQRIRMIENGVITTFAGTGEQGFGGDGGPCGEAVFNMPRGQAGWPGGKICIDAFDNIYVPDVNNHRVRIIEADSHELPAPGVSPAHTENIIHTLAGNGQAYEAGISPPQNGIPALEASLRFPGDVAVSPDGEVYIADTFNHAVRKVDKDGMIWTVAGKIGQRGYGGDGGHPSQSLLDRPSGVAFDSAGNLYIADSGNHRIRVVWK